MRVLFVNSSLTDGGSERAMVLIANQMADLGHDVHMILVRDKPHVYQVDSRIRLTQLNYKSSSKLGVLAERIGLIRGCARKVCPDCIVSFMWDINVMTLAATFGLHTRLVVSERAYPGSAHRGKLSKALEALFYSLADAIVYQTEGARAFCPARLKKKSCVIPNAVSAPNVPPYAGERTKRVVSVGRLTEQKNYPMLLRAFADFSKTHKEYRLQIFGEGRLKPELVDLADKLRIGEKVDFCGFVDDVASRINDASMFVLSSNYEGISNAMAEAMAIGLPVICTDCPVGGAAMMIEDGVNGLLVPVDDVRSLASAMSRIADDKEFALMLSAKAKGVATRFSAQLIGGMWMNVLEKNDVDKA